MLFVCYDVIGILALTNYFQEYKMLNGTRHRRALLPFVGQISSFLFGTVSESDLATIRRNIVTLSVSQQVLSHVAQETHSPECHTNASLSQPTID